MGIVEYIIRPMFTGEGYNPINTAFIILTLFTVLYLFWEKLMEIDWSPKNWKKFVPLIVMGILLRVSHDFGITKSVIFITPWVWILTFLIGIVLYNLKSGLLELLPLFVSAILISKILNYISLSGLYIYLLSASISIIISLIAEKFGVEKISFSSQLFDASTTAIGLSKGLYEEHVLARIVTNRIGPFGIFVIKIPALIVLYYFASKIQNENERNFLFFATFVIGIGPAIRNMLIGLSV